MSRYKGIFLDRPRPATLTFEPRVCSVPVIARLSTLSAGLSTHTASRVTIAIVRLLPAIAVLAALVGCNANARPGLSGDGSATPEDTPEDGPDDAEASAPPPADAPFPCGPQPGLTCGPNQYCLVGCVDEGPISCLPRLDSGVCPPNSSLSGGCDLNTGPCELDDLSSFPTMCFDDIDASPCGGPDPAISLEDRTIYCACTL
jgi:hypothetical protein